MKNKAKEKYTNIPLPIGLTNQINDIIEKGDYGYKTKSEFVKEAVREKLRELINLKALKSEIKKQS